MVNQKHNRISGQCRLTALARWAVARGPNKHRGAHVNLCMLCTAWFCW